MRDAALFGEGTYPRKFFKRYIDDLFFIWIGSLEMLLKFLEHLNTLHPTIKFTWSYSSKKVNFLDVLVMIVNNEIQTDLYRKPTDRCQYLLPSSCHPAHITRNIPYSLAYRIIRICSTPEFRDKRLRELREMLLSRDYRPRSVYSDITRAKSIPRVKALERVEKKKNNRVVFVITYDPRLPSISNIFRKHHTVMVENHYEGNFP